MVRRRLPLALAVAALTLATILAPARAHADHPPASPPAAAAAISAGR